MKMIQMEKLKILKNLIKNIYNKKKKLKINTNRNNLINVKSGFGMLVNVFIQQFG